MNSKTTEENCGNFYPAFAKRFECWRSEKIAWHGDSDKLKKENRPKQGETMLQRTIGRQGPQLSRIVEGIDRNKFNFSSRESTGGTGVT